MGAQNRSSFNLTRFIFQRQLGENKRKAFKTIPPSLQIPVESILDEEKALLSCVILGFTNDCQHLLSYTATASPACDNKPGHHLQVWSFGPGEKSERLYNIRLFAHEDGNVERDGPSSAEEALAEQNLKITAFEAPVDHGVLVIHGIVAMNNDELASHHFTFIPGLSRRPATINVAHYTRVLHERVRGGDPNFSQGLQHQCLGNNFDPSLQFIPPDMLLLASCHSLCCIIIRAAVCDSRGTLSPVRREPEAALLDTADSAEAVGRGADESAQLRESEQIDAWDLPESPEPRRAASDSGAVAAGLAEPCRPAARDPGCHPAVDLLDANGSSRCLNTATTAITCKLGGSATVGLAAVHDHPSVAALDVGELVDKGLTRFFGGRAPYRGWNTSTYEVELLETLPADPKVAGGQGGGLGTAVLLLSCFLFPSRAYAHMPLCEVPAAQLPFTDRLVLMGLECSLSTLECQFLWLAEFVDPVATPHVLPGIRRVAGQKAALKQSWPRFAFLADYPHRWAGRVKRWNWINSMRQRPGRVHSLTNCNVVAGSNSLQHIFHQTLPLCLLGFGSSPE